MSEDLHARTNQMAGWNKWTKRNHTQIYGSTAGLSPAQGQCTDNTNSPTVAPEALYCSGMKLTICRSASTVPPKAFRTANCSHTEQESNRQQGCEIVTIFTEKAASASTINGGWPCIGGYLSDLFMAYPKITEIAEQYLDRNESGRKAETATLAAPPPHVGKISISPLVV